jgi:hypothetical protein
MDFFWNNNRNEIGRYYNLSKSNYKKYDLNRNNKRIF